jgi:hypothetical protein
MGYGYNYFLVGRPLCLLADDVKSYGLEARQFGISSSLQVQFLIMHQSVLNLQGKSPNATYLRGDVMDQDEILEKVVEGQGRMMTLRDICIFRLMLASIFRSTTTLRDILDALSDFPSFNPALARMHLRFVFTGYGAYQMFHKTRENRYYAMGGKALEYFKEAMEKGSLNAYPMYAFLLAVKTPSKETFDEAIKVCARSNLVNFQALSNECALLYYLDHKQEALAYSHLMEAIRLYEAWGANGKVQQLRGEYGRCLLSHQADFHCRDRQLPHEQNSDDHSSDIREMEVSEVELNDQYYAATSGASGINSKGMSSRSSDMSGKFTAITENDSGWDTDCLSSRTDKSRKLPQSMDRIEFFSNEEPHERRPSSSSKVVGTMSLC